MSARRLVRQMLAGVTAGALLGALLTTSAMAAAPGNDDSATPRVVGALPYSNGPYDTTEATSAATDPGFCFEPTVGPDRSTVWYSFTPSTSDRFLADTFGSDYDTTLYVGTSDGAGGMTVIGCTDDSQGLQSAVAWDAAAGTTYLIMIGTCCGPSAGAGGGNLVFHVDLAPPPPAIDLIVSASGSFTPYGSATIRGTIACSNTVGAAEIGLLLSQRVGRFVIRGGGSDVFECSATPTPWAIVITSEDGKFLGGQAMVDAFAFACGPIECVDTSTQVSVRLRR